MRPQQTPNGAHMDIGAHGDLSTLHWVQSEPCPHPDFLACEVTYGANPGQGTYPTLPYPGHQGSPIRQMCMTDSPVLSGVPGAARPHMSCPAGRGCRGQHAMPYTRLSLHRTCARLSAKEP